MIRLGLTGSIGMGKSTVAAMFADEGVPVFDADAAVHRLQGPSGRVVAAIEARFPDTTGPAGVDRTALGEAVLGDPAALEALEAIVHPAVGEETAAFLAAHADAPIVLLDVPLLFETGGERRFDAVAVVSAPAAIQRARVLARPGMTSARFEAILARQLPDAAKRARADHVIPTGGTLDETRAVVRALIACLAEGRAADSGAMREIVFDTETTGLSPTEGHRLVEIGCVELFNRVETGRVFHAYFNPRRAMPSEAEAIHGLSTLFLSDKPCFDERVEEMLEFIGESPLVAHNAMFDFGFINWELEASGRAAVCTSRMIDTLALARARHPGAKHSLDALCTRYGVDRSQRIKHGALLDAQLLAQVYVELIGGRQIGFLLAEDGVDAMRAAAAAGPLLSGAARLSRRMRPPRPHAPSAVELARHRAFVTTLADPLWASFAAVVDAPESRA